MINVVFYEKQDISTRLRCECISAQDAVIYESHNNYSATATSLNVISLG